MTALAKYDHAKRALSEAKSLPDVQKVRGLAAAIEAVARIAGDRTLIADAIELSVNADRRLGELLKEAKAEGRFKASRPEKRSGPEHLTLEQIGIDRKLSSRAQRLADMPQKAFRSMVATHRQSVLGGRNVSFEATLRETDLQRARRAHEAKTYEGGRAEDLQALIDAERTFGAIYADPAWLFLSRGDNGDGRSASAHYTTTTLEAMKALPVERLAAPDCVLFMWMVDWCPQDALDLIRAWGFTHKTTAFTWIKSTSTGDAEFMGQGYWTRANPEVCWLATRGHPKRLNADVRQLMTAPVMEHSRKPDETYARIERLVAGPYLELFARRPRDGWVSWGNEVPPPQLRPGIDYDDKTGEIIENDSGFNSPPAPAAIAGPEAGESPPPVPAFTVLAEDDGGGAFLDSMSPSASARMPQAASAPPPDRAARASTGDGDNNLEIPPFLRRRA